MQPVCHRYGSRYKHPLALGQCSWCGTLQLYERFPLKRIVPVYPWVVRYSEPEEHLDGLVRDITKLSGITKDTKFCGVSFKDDTTLARLTNHGYKRTLSVSKQDIPTAQDYITTRARDIVRQYGKQDTVIARHILEHCYDPRGFLDALQEMVSADGYIILEVPGVDQALKDLDYTTIWEEHTLYFTKQIFRWMLSFFGFKILSFQEVSYPLENSLIAVVRPGMSIYRRRVKRVDAFARGFAVQKKMLHTLLNVKKTIAVFGAGHLGCVWVNIFELKKYINYFVDDDLKKGGLQMPGSGIPIIPTNRIENNIDLCLLAAHPRNEEVTLAKNNLFFGKVDQVLSIFPSSPRALNKLL